VAGDPSKGYYSYDLGRWHVVSLNSVCGNAASEFRQPGGCGPDSPMVGWLRRGLAANPRACTLATFHHPLFNSGNLGNHPNAKSIWDALYEAGAVFTDSGTNGCPEDPLRLADLAMYRSRKREGGRSRSGPPPL
jgi:hypothetical protein